MVTANIDASHRHCLESQREDLQQGTMVLRNVNNGRDARPIIKAKDNELVIKDGPRSRNKKCGSAAGAFDGTSACVHTAECPVYAKLLTYLNRKQGHIAAYVPHLINSAPQVPIYTDSKHTHNISMTTIINSVSSLGLGVSTLSVCFMIFSVQFFVFSARSSNISNGASKSVFSAWPNFSSVY